MSDNEERKALLGGASAPPYNNDQLPTYQESIGGQQNTTMSNRTGADGFQPMSFSSSPPPPPPPPIAIYQPGYQSMPFIQTQVILVGGCPTCRYLLKPLILT